MSVFDPPQYCKYCGKELVTKIEHYGNQNQSVFLVCPSISSPWKVWNIPNWSKHTSHFVRDEYEDTLLNYDPITGERIKK